MRSGALAALLLVAAMPRAARADAAACVAAAEKGQSLRDEGRLVASRTAFEACGQEDCPSTVRSDCVQWLAEVRKRIPTVVAAATVNGVDARDVRVTIDGASAVLTDGRATDLDPGPHRFRYEHAGDAPIEETVVLREGEKDRVLRVAFGAAALAPAPPSRKLAVAMTATALASAAAWGVLALTGFVTIQNCNGDRSACNVDTTTTTVLTEFVFGDIGLGVAVVTGAIATWLFLKHPARKSAVSFGPSALGISF